MNLSELLGDKYHEGMTIDEINTALSGMKLADLSTGAYVDKNKYTADLKAKDDELNKKAQALHEKLSADEKKAAADAEKDDLIAKLQETIKNQTISTNRSKAEALTSEMKTILDIKDDDATYADFINNIAGEDGDKTSSLATYIAKAIKDSYEKGKKDGTKNNLGTFSSGVGKQESDKGKEIGSFGKELAKSSVPTVDADLYFKRD